MVTGYRFITVVAVAWIVFLCSSAASAQCAKDTDCKGSRTCVKGECVEPPPAAPTPEPSTGQCSKDSDCKGDRVCSKGSCVDPGVDNATSRTDAQCVRDSDCKGDRVCERGGCVDPGMGRGRDRDHDGLGASVPDGAAWYSGYVSVGAIFSFAEWGKLTPNDLPTDFDTESEFAPGVHLSGYAQPTPSFAIGGYFSYMKGKQKLKDTPLEGDNGRLGVGLSLKLGGRVSNTVWLGYAMDAGLHVLYPEDEDAAFGVQAYPRLHLDVLFNAQGGSKQGIFVGLGPVIVPYFSATIRGYDAAGWSVGPALLFGGSFGG